MTSKCLHDSGLSGVCSEARFIDPVKGEVVLCEEHYGQFLRGEIRAPALRRVFDYEAALRKTFIVEELAGFSGDLPVKEPSDVAKNSN